MGETLWLVTGVVCLPIILWFYRAPGRNRPDSFAPKLAIWLFRLNVRFGDTAQFGLGDQVGGREAVGDGSGDLCCSTHRA